METCFVWNVYKWKDIILDYIKVLQVQVIMKENIFLDFHRSLNLTETEGQT